MSKHTQGPWSYLFVDDVYYVRPPNEDEGDIAAIDLLNDTGRGRGTHANNAALISAAPEMLEALKTSLLWHKGDKWRYDIEHAIEWSEREKELIALINKAEK